MIILQELSNLVQTNENDIEAKVQSINTDLAVRKDPNDPNKFSDVIEYMIFCHSRS